MATKSLNILLVEDDELDVMNVQRAFEKNRIRSSLYVATNGLEALEILRGDSIPSMPRDRRLVLLDLNMPKMNGIEFLRELRGDPDLRLIPVVVLTTSEEERDKVEAYNFNVAGYLVKPIKPEDFVDLVARFNDYWSASELP
jgi:CheY-like chemotaxis protein